MKKWEYKAVNEKLSESQLNNFGEQGWELVSHTAVAVANILGSAMGQYYVFKREKK
ncbi:MAG: DUF4177 domain-containing protein [Nanoarchaeota archaeon]